MKFSNLFTMVVLLTIQLSAHAQPASLVSYWNFDESSSGTGNALNQAVGDDGVFAGVATRTVGLQGIGAADFSNADGERVAVGNSFSAIAGISLELLIMPNWSGSSGDYDHLFRKEDAGARILLSFQNDALNGSAVPPVAPGPVLSLGLVVNGSYSEMDMPLDGVAGRPTLAELKDGNAHHVVATYDSTSGNKSIYIDGSLRYGTNLGVGNLLTSGGGAEALIGSGISAGIPAGAFDGVIDEVALYNAALTASEILVDYNNTLSGKNYFGVSSVSPTSVLPVPTLPVYGIVLSILGLLALASRRLRSTH